MDDVRQYDTHIKNLSKQLQTKLKLRQAPFPKLVAQCKHRVPRKVFEHAQALVDAETNVRHPRLSVTVDFQALNRSAKLVAEHLDSIDLADQRKGQVLSILGSLSFNLILAFTLFVVVLVWRGIV